MKSHHPSNERMKRAYYLFLEQAKRQNEASVDGVAKAVSRFEEYTKWRDFKAFHHQQAVGFKTYLAKQLNTQTGKPLSKATMNSTLRALKSFFQWLSMQPGYKSGVNYNDAEYFNLSEKEVRIASAKRQKPVPTLEQIHHVLAKMPAVSDVERRDRALVAFILLTGARDSAVASLKLKHVDLAAGSVFQDARDVQTKASKTFTTYFFPVDGEALAILVDWIGYLQTELLFGNDDPLFPKTAVRRTSKKVFAEDGVLVEHWSNASPIRKLFCAAFENAGLPYFNPHSFRKTLVQLGERVCQTPEEFKAWSQNLGHSGVLTTFTAYGEVQPGRQSDIIKALHKSRESGMDANAEVVAKAVARMLVEQGGYPLKNP